MRTFNLYTPTPKPKLTIEQLKAEIKKLWHKVDMLQNEWDDRTLWPKIAAKAEKLEEQLNKMEP